MWYPGTVREARPMIPYAKTTLPPTRDREEPLTAAERMRRHRDRRRRCVRYLGIELREAEVDALVSTGFLRAETRNNRKAVTEALYAHLDGTLGRCGDTAPDTQWAS
jgi:hypothetical protein